MQEKLKVAMKKKRIVLNKDRQYLTKVIVKIVMKSVENK